MGFVRALVAIVVIAVAASPLLGTGAWTQSDVPTVYADAGQISLRDKKQDKDNEKKDKNRNSDEDEKGNRERTREERRSDKDNEEEDDDSPRVVTNTYSEDNYALEGLVVALKCDTDPKEIVIRTVDGEATLFQGPRDEHNRIDRLYCGDLIVGDYVFVHEAMKRNESAYDAFYISCQKDRDEGDDNSNDNDGDTDPNCTHIWSR
ncbi:MAG: hypothetical protein IT306_18850 [Chloroflexi bacterium]|nr:hypothetical protein [Chloroflexota bacterium]